MNAETTRALIQRAAEGDDGAWCELVDHWAPRVHALVAANCKDHDLAEEITQSAFCTVASRIHAYVEQGRFDSWIFRIAMNRLRDEMRRRKRQASPMGHEHLGAVTRSGREDRASHQRVDEDMAAALWDAVRELSEPEQLVLQMRHVAGLGFKQIADQLEQPMGTVLARHFRALKRLREALGDDIAEDFLSREA